MENGSQIANPEDESTIKVVVYGTRWCAATQYVRRFLDRNNVTYSFRDLDRGTGSLRNFPPLDRERTSRIRRIP